MRQQINLFFFVPIALEFTAPNKKGSKVEKKTLNNEIEGLQWELAKALDTIEAMQSSHHIYKQVIVLLKESLESEQMKARVLKAEDLGIKEQIEQFNGLQL
eukprot:15067098-Ditylum_brightwellii.AAC.1